MVQPAALNAFTFMYSSSVIIKMTPSSSLAPGKPGSTGRVTGQEEQDLSYERESRVSIKPGLR